MTISYQLDVSRASAVSFFRLLFRWRASLWKNVLKELLIWCTLYFIIAFCYRSPFIMTDAQRTTFENLITYLNKQLNYIPLTFILGFYVSTIVQRWTIVFTNMGYIESEALLISSYVQGDDEETKMMRRSMVRYMCLSQLLVYRDISVRVRKRFPTHQSIVQAGFMLDHEKEKLESIKLDYDKYWVPINWSYTLFFEARRAEKIACDAMTNKLCDEMKVFRNNLQMLCNYDWVPIPLVYPQVVMIAVYFYFIICLVSRQFIPSHRNNPAKGEVDVVVPVMTIIQFVFFVGWMKAAEVLLNPMGEDDDDFECNFLLDKNLATSLSIVDDYRGDVPPMEPDQFWLSGHVDPIYPASAANEDINPLVGSAVRAKLSSADDEDKPVEMVVRPSTSAPSARAASLRHRFSRRMSTMFGASVGSQNERTNRRGNLHQTAFSLDISDYPSKGWRKNRKLASVDNDRFQLTSECRSVSCCTLHNFDLPSPPTHRARGTGNIRSPHFSSDSPTLSHGKQMHSQKSTASFASTLFTVDEEDQTTSSQLFSDSIATSSHRCTAASEIPNEEKILEKSKSMEQ